jgi:hypothetical protein
MKRAIICLAIFSGSINLAGCEAVRETFGIANRTPVISSFDYNPKSGITKNDVVTFSVVANDPEGKPLQYNWTTSKGFLTGNAGSTVNWRPANQNNALEPGLSTVSVVVSDGVMTATASVNIYVSDGIAVIQPQPSSSPSATPTPVITASPAATPTPVPTATPTVSASPVSTPVPTAVPTVSVSASVGPTATPVPTAQPTEVPVPTATPSASSVIIQE